MRSRIGVATVLLAVSIMGRFARAHLSGFENPTMAAWPNQVIFGFYFAILAVALERLRTIFQTASHSFSRQALLLLVVVGLCLDLVLVNVQETVLRVDASYGIVVLWDVMTFFVWMRAIDLCRPHEDAVFRTSLLIAITPLFALGREILFLPYSVTGDIGRAYLDLLFGNLFVCLWLFISAGHPTGRRVTKGLSCLVFTGCVYWILNAIENIAFLAWSPLSPSLYRAFAHAGVPVFLLSIFYALIAGSVTVIVWRWNVFRFGTCFGITTHSHEAAYQGTGFRGSGRFLHR